MIYEHKKQCQGLSIIADSACLETQERVEQINSLKFVRASYFDLCSRHIFMLLEREY